MLNLWDGQAKYSTNSDGWTLTQIETPLQGVSWGYASTDEIRNKTKEGTMNIKELIKNNKYICNSDNKNYMEITEFKDNKISICPQGGGFVKSIDIDNGKFIDDVVSKKN